MIDSYITFLGILLNITGICLWGTSMALIFKDKDKDDQRLLKRNIKRNVRTFEEEIFAQIFKQRSELTFKKISDKIETEQQSLLQSIERANLNRNKKLLSSDLNDISRMVFKEATKIPNHKAKTADKYTEAIRLAANGLTSKKISEKINLPKGEVELLVKLRKIDETRNSAQN